MATIRVNIRTAVNNSAIRRETRNGRDVIIVPSATLPDNVVMNGGLYPPEEIEASYKQLERTPAPMGHPMAGNQYISAREPEAINQYWVGAWNENVRREDGRVKLDKVIDIEVAKRHPQGSKLLDAIDKGDPIHTSTGLFLNREYTPGNGHAWIARNMMFDHDAILIGEQGAATPAQGVGMMVNGEQCEVVNSECEFDQIGWAADMLMDAIEQDAKSKKRASFKEKLVDMLKNLLTSQAQPVFNSQEEPAMAITDEQFTALSAKVDALATNQSTLVTDIVAKVTESLAPVVAQVNAITEANKAAEETEAATLRSRIVNTGLLDEDGAKELSINALRKLAEKCKPGTAAPLIGHFAPNSDEDPFKGYDLNANIDGGAK